VPIWAAGVEEQSLKKDEHVLHVVDDGVSIYFTAQLEFELPIRAKEALERGIPMYFVERARIFQKRWYWSDKKISEEVRFIRLSYQPLTRKWRLNTSSVSFANPGQGMSLGQNFDDLDDALSVLQRINRWSIADSKQLNPADRYTAQMEFKLDLSQLPRPFQIGALGRSGWDLSIQLEKEWDQSLIASEK
jgi:hypothetical protein